MRRLRSPALPIEAGRRRSTEELQVRGFAAATSSTGWEACERGIRFAHLSCDAIHFELRTVGSDRVQLRLLREGTRSLGHRCDNECALAGWVAQLRGLLAEDFLCHRASFRHPRPADTRLHTEHFGVEPEFDAPHDAIEFASAFLDRKPGGSNPAMRAFFDRHAEELLAQLVRGDPPTTSAVKRLVAARLASGLPQMGDNAAQLGLSERGLRRKLNADGSRYQDIVAEVRIDVAKRLLATPSESLSGIAFILGFSEHSAFSRFFRKQTGLTPRQYREAEGESILVAATPSPGTAK